MNKLQKIIYDFLLVDCNVDIDECSLLSQILIKVLEEEGFAIIDKNKLNILFEAMAGAARLLGPELPERVNQMDGIIAHLRQRFHLPQEGVTIGEKIVEKEIQGEFKSGDSFIAEFPKLWIKP